MPWLLILIFISAEKRFLIEFKYTFQSYRLKGTPMRLVKHVRLHWTSRKYLYMKLLHVEQGSQLSQWWLFFTYSWISKQSLMNVVSVVVAFYNYVVNVVYDEIILHIELNISAAKVVNISA